MTADWETAALCRVAPYRRWFVAPRPRHMTVEQWHDQQKSACAACPVQADCLAYTLRMEAGADKNGRYGVAGGLTPKERAAAARGHGDQDGAA